MKQIRVQPLNETYQQLGTLLCKLALNFQTTDYTTTAAWINLIAEVQHTYTVFKSYTEKEENILFPILHSYEPALAAIIRDNQYVCMRYLGDLNALFTAMYAATDKQKSKLFSHTLLYRFDEFVAATMQQIKEQEVMINAVLWRYYSDKELAPIAASLNIIVHQRDTAFADAIINNIVPATTTNTTCKHTPAAKAYKQHRASKTLALAV